MKKLYEKPEIVFECFSVSNNIAAGCEKIVGLPSVDVCGIPSSTPGMSVFADVTGSSCTIPGNGSEGYDGYCYHNPSTDQNLFNS